MSAPVRDHTAKMKGWTDFDQAVCERLVELREEAGLTQADLARMIGVHQTRISAAESGYRRLRFEEAVLICHELGLKVTELVP